MDYIESRQSVKHWLMLRWLNREFKDNLACALLYPYPNDLNGFIKADIKPRTIRILEFNYLKYRSSESDKVQ